MNYVTEKSQAGVNQQGKQCLGSIEIVNLINNNKIKKMEENQHQYVLTLPCIVRVKIQRSVNASHHHAGKNQVGFF